MNQYPKWLLAMNLPNIVVPMCVMIFYMFGYSIANGLDSMFWEFILYLLQQLLWIVPLSTFFLSLLAWGMYHERGSVVIAIFGWLFNTVAVLLLVLA